VDHDSWRKWGAEEYSKDDKFELRTSIITRYEVNDEQLKNLTSQGWTDLRITTTDGDMDFSKRKPAKEIQTVLGCVSP